MRRFERTAFDPKAAMVVGGFLVVLIGVLSVWWSAPADKDSTGDWLVARAAADGLDPYQDVRILALHYDVDLVEVPELDRGWVHFRTPGTLLLLQGSRLIDSVSWYRLMLLMSSFALVVLVFWATPEVSGIRLKALWASPLLLVAIPVYMTAQWGTQSAIVASLLGAGWALALRRDSGWGGVGVGAAMVLKLWPAIALVPLVAQRRWRSIAVAGGLFGGLNVVGMLLFDVSMPRIWTAMGQAMQGWLAYSSNGSIQGQFARTGISPLWSTLGLAAVGGVVLWGGGRDRSGLWPLAIVAGLLCSPLSWDHYDVALIPVAVWTVGRRNLASVSGWVWLLVAEAGVFLLLLQVTVSLGSIVFFARLVLFVGIAVHIQVASPVNVETS